MLLETERLILRDYLPDDRDAYIRIKRDPVVMYYMGDIALNDDDDLANADFDAVLTDAQSEHRTYYFFHMERKDTHAQVGSVGYTVSARTPFGKLVHAGYFSYPEFWGHGYMTEAFSRVLRFAFEENEVFRVSTGCLQENKGSERVMRKCGMIREATLKQCVWHDGRMKTRVAYRLLRDEWERLLK